MNSQIFMPIIFLFQLSLKPIIFINNQTNTNFLCPLEWHQPHNKWCKVVQRAGEKIRGLIITNNKNCRGVNNFFYLSQIYWIYELELERGTTSLANLYLFAFIIIYTKFCPLLTKNTWNHHNIGYKCGKFSVNFYTIT